MGAVTSQSGVSRSGGEIHDLHDFFIDIGLRAERSGAPSRWRQTSMKRRCKANLILRSPGTITVRRSSALKRRDEAIKALRMPSPKTALFCYDLGLALYEVGRYAEAREVFAPIVARDPNLERASSNLGLSSMTNLALCDMELGHPDTGGTSSLTRAPRQRLACFITRCCTIGRSI